MFYGLTLVTSKVIVDIKETQMNSMSKLRNENTVKKQ
jgi:hypothetical protein